MKFGIQTYGSRKEWEKDLEGFCKAVSGWGLKRLEPCVAFDRKAEQAGLGFWTPEQVQNALPLLEKYGMEIVSFHAFASDVEAALPALCGLVKACGAKQVVLPCPADISEESYQAYGAMCKRLAGALKGENAQLLLHNGGEEIKAKLDGRTAYEFLLDACGGEVFAQPDVGWLFAGGEDPEAFLWRNGERVKAIHYKDYSRGDEEQPAREMAVGEGDVDLLACFQFARAHGLPQVLDMDTCGLSEIEKAAGLLNGFTFRRDRTSSVLCALDVDTGELEELHRFGGVMEAPNWLPDGDTMIFNADGRLYKYSVSSDEVEYLDTADCGNCNNDHVVSFDGARLGFSHGWPSHVYVMELSGGVPRQVTAQGPSYFHGWSPDGEELIYCAFRGEAVDLYTIPAEGGEERRVTDSIGFNDGPEYSPDGKTIWFNSTRSGLMQVWRMDRNTGEMTQMTDSGGNNWFPHVSPDGKRVVYLTFREGHLEPQEHLPNMQVELWIMDSDGSRKRKLLDFFGGQGSINVNSWSPDNRRVALVVYELEHPAAGNSGKGL